MHELYKIDENEIYNASLSASVIYQGYEKKTGTKVAIKELKKNKLKQEYLHEMAKNEFSIQASLCCLSEDSNIVQVKDYFENENAYYLIMEYSEEPDYFEDLLENRYCPVSDEKTLKAFAFDILTGLEECHKNNVIHCDIKPQNFLLFRNNKKLVEIENLGKSLENLENLEDLENKIEICGEEEISQEEELSEDFILKLADFGLAHVIPEGESKAFMQYPCGTFAYVAPEITKVIFISLIFYIRKKKYFFLNKFRIVMWIIQSICGPLASASTKWLLLIFLLLLNNINTAKVLYLFVIVTGMAMILNVLKT